MKVLPEELMNSVLGKLMDLITSGDDVVPKSKDNFLTWLTPGTPYHPDDLTFLNEGFTGIYKKKEGDQTDKPTDKEKTDEGENDSQDVSAEELLAQDSSIKYQQAEALSNILNMIPDTSGVGEGGGFTMNAWNVENNLASAYYQTLKFSQVSDIELDEKIKAKIDKLRGLLQTKKIVKDLITDEESEIIVASPMVNLYNDKLQNYLNVALEYNSRRIEALASKNPTAVHYWAINSSLLRNKVLAAKKDWVTNGYKEQYEQIAAFIGQVEGRSMVALKAKYLDDMEKSTLTGQASGADFYYSSLIPGSFIKSDSGWTEFSFDKGDSKSDYKFSKKDTSAKAKASYFGFGASGGGSSSKTKATSKIDSSKFSMRFKIAQVPIYRPWFNVNFLTSKYWRFDQENPEFKNDMVSDGNTPPEGMIPAYTTTAIFIKDLHMNFGEFHAFSEYKKDKISGSGSAGFSFGPFSAGGSASHSSTKISRENETHFEKQGISIDGMQLIGFKCHVLQKAPDPNPNIEKWI